MTGRKQLSSSFRQTTVLVRADIFERAREQNIDISDTCNTALAGLLGIDYRQQRLDDVAVSAPVIIAKDGGVPSPAMSAPRKGSQPPVINADDPSAAGAIAKSRKQPVKKQEAPEPEKAGPATLAQKKVPAPKPAPTTTKKKESRTKKDDLLKKFIAAKIIRDDSEDAAVPKEELYGIFSRWCREQKKGTTPDAKSVTVALKTRFAFQEKSVAGTPCWVNVRLK